MADDVVPFDRSEFFARLRAATPARIGLARTGVSIGTAEHLALQLAHAQARDAVHDALDVEALSRELRSHALSVARVASRARDRATYLARPDLGRRLDDASRATLATLAAEDAVAVVIADGLSARAVSSHALPLLTRLLPLLAADGRRVALVVVATQGRVALGDEIGALLRADLVCLLIGERPGLSSPDSLGVYLTWGPRLGRTDAERNCVSNIRPAGLSYDDAARRCAWLIREALRRKVTGTALKDDGAPDTRSVSSADITRLSFQE